MIEWIALTISLISLTWTTTDVISNRKEKDKMVKEQIIQKAINDFTFAYKTDANPNPVDSTFIVNDTIKYYKQGEFIGSSVIIKQKNKKNK